MSFNLWMDSQAVEHTTTQQNKKKKVNRLWIYNLLDKNLRDGPSNPRAPTEKTTDGEALFICPP